MFVLPQTADLSGYDTFGRQEYDPRLNPELFELVEKSLKDIIGGIQEGTDLITSIINGMADDLSLKRIVDEFLTAFRDIPKQVRITIYDNPESSLSDVSVS